MTLQSRRAGPVLSDATSRAIEAAVLEELALHGYGGLTIDAVARRAAVGKAAIYRRSPSKEAMVLTIVQGLSTDATLFPDTGGIESDLRTLFSAAAAQLRHRLVSRIVPDLLAEAARDSAFGVALNEAISLTRRERGSEMVRRAVLRGELPAGIDIDLAVDLIAAPLYWRVIVTRGPTDEGNLDRLVRATLAALRAA